MLFIHCCVIWLLYTINLMSINFKFFYLFFPSALETLNPMIICPPDVMRYISSSADEVLVTWPLPTASDSSGIASLTPTNPVYSSGSGLFGSGTHGITYTARDGAGNQASCSFLITVTCKNNTLSV